MAFDDIASIYDETRIVPNGVVNRFYDRTLRKKFRSTPNLVVLDAGVGTGGTVSPLLDLGIHLVGIDISKKMLQKMAEKLGRRTTKSQVSLVLGDVTKLPFGNSSFDTIIAVHLLHLLKNWKQAILETKRVAKPKASFLIANYDSPELETKLGQTYLKILLDTVHRRSALKRLIYHILNILEQRVKLAKALLKKAPTTGNWELYLKGLAKSRETHTISWREKIAVSTIADRLEKRFVSIKTAMPHKDYESFMSKLDKWRNKKGDNSLLEITRKFTYIKVQF